MEMSGQLHAPAVLPQGKSPCYPLDRRLGGTQSRSGRGCEEKNSQHPPAIEIQNPDHPARSPALYQLSCHGSILFGKQNGIGLHRLQACTKITNCSEHSAETSCKDDEISGAITFFDQLNKLTTQEKYIVQRK
jgi:hypothetical protein